MSEALRSIFAELGFEVDLAALEAADKALRETTRTTEDAAKATDDASKKRKAGQADSAKDAQKALTAEERLARVRERASEEQADAAAKKAFDASDEGKAHAAWQQTQKYTEVLQQLGINSESASQRLAKFTQAAKASAVSLGLAMVLLRVARAAVDFANEFAQAGEELRDTAIETRTTTNELQELRHAAVQGGVGLDRMNSAISTFGQGLRAGERWGSGTTRMLRRLGITTRDASGHIRPTGELLNETAIALGRIENPYRRARVAQQLFGESGRRMLAIMHEGPGGIAALRAEMEELGGGVTPEAIAASREYTMATEKLARAQDSLRSVLAVTLLPVLSWVAGGLAKLGGLAANLTRGTHVVKIGLYALGVVGAAVALSLIAAWAPVAAPFLGIAAAVAVAVLVFDDLATFVDGGDSALGRFIDSMFGVGTSAEYVHELREEWEAVQDALAGAIGAVARFLGLQEEVSTNVARPSPPGGTARRPRVREAPGTTVARAGVTTGTAPVTRPVTTGSVVTAPATRTVPAPAPSTRAARTVVREYTSAPVLHFHGVTDARQIAGQVRDVIRQEDRDRRDGDHPAEDEEG